MSFRGVAVVFLLIVALFATGVSWLLSIAFLVLAALAFYYLSPKCDKCGARFSYRRVGSYVEDRERGYGIVTRSEVTNKKSRDGDGNVRYESETTKRQERAPVVRTTTRYDYTCAKCGNVKSKRKTRQQEDFSPREEATPQTVIIQKEVVKVPCRYCGTLNEIATQSNCTKCGAPLK